MSEPATSAEPIKPFDLEADEKERTNARQLFARAIVVRESLTNLPDARFAGIVLTALRDRSVSQDKLAQRIGMSSATIGRWAKQKNMPPAYVRRMCLMAIAAVIADELRFDLSLPSDLGPEFDLKQLAAASEDAIAAAPAKAPSAQTEGARAGG